MALFKELFSSSRIQKLSRERREGQGSQGDVLSGASGPETKPVKMNLEERMALRRELLYEIIKLSLLSCSVAANTYRFKVMRTDKRGHCFVVLLDMSPTFMAGPAGEHVSLKAMAAVLIKNAEISYGLHVGGVYWRADETLDVTVDNWAQPAVSAPSALSTDSVRQSNNNKSEAVTAKEIADFEAASQEESAIQSGSRTYSSGLIPMMEEMQHK